MMKTELSEQESTIGTSPIVVTAHAKPQAATIGAKLKNVKNLNFPR